MCKEGLLLLCSVWLIMFLVFWICCVEMTLCVRSYPKWTDVVMLFTLAKKNKTIYFQWHPFTILIVLLSQVKNKKLILFCFHAALFCTSQHTEMLTCCDITDSICAVCSYIVQGDSFSLITLGHVTVSFIDPLRFHFVKLCTVSTFHLVTASSNISLQTFFIANEVNLLGLFHPETVAASKICFKRRAVSWYEVMYISGTLLLSLPSKAHICTSTLFLLLFM